MLQTDTVAAIQTTVIREWADLFNWPALTATGLRVAGALVVAIIANYALKAVLRSVERSSEKDGIVTAQEQRTRTLLSLLRSVGRVVIWVMTLFMVLGALGLQLGPLLAGAGVVGSRSPLARSRWSRTSSAGSSS
jgi:small conductance mechanosensitive channel